MFSIRCWCRHAQRIVLVCLLSPVTLAELGNDSALDEYLERQVRDTHIPGIVALVADGDEILYENAFGVRDAANQEAMTTDTIFRIASMTKPVAATVIMMLVDEGKLRLDDPIARYVPAFAERAVLERFDRATGKYTTRPAASAVTIRQLMSHSSGLAYPFASDAISAIAASADAPGSDALPLVYDPGTSWSYAGGIAVVAGVAERIEGVGLDTLMRERLFEPLGMHDTGFIVKADAVDRVATVHRLGPDGVLVETPNPVDIRASVSGDGGLNSTASDYARFVQFFLNDGVAPDGRRLLSHEAISEMTRNQLGVRTVTLQDEPTPLLARAFPLGAGRDGFGLGFQVTGEHASASVRAPGSLSWAGIFNTEFWIDPARGVGGVLLMQYLPFYDAAAIETLQGFEALVYAGLPAGQ
ncbi:MAG: serine hydrolase domain-containing protein [Gammaproteobacteria bacterium]